MSSSRIPEIKQIQALMDRVDTHRHQPQPQPPVALSPAELTQHTLDVYHDQGVEVDENLVRQLAHTSAFEPLSPSLPQVATLPLESRTRKVYASGITAFIGFSVAGLGLAWEGSERGAMICGVGILLSMVFYFFGITLSGQGDSQRERQIKVLESMLRGASLLQLTDVLEHPDIEGEVSRQARLELMRRRRLAWDSATLTGLEVSITVDAPEVVK